MCYRDNDNEFVTIGFGVNYIIIDIPNIFYLSCITNAYNQSVRKCYDNLVCLCLTLLTL